MHIKRIFQISLGIISYVFFSANAGQIAKPLYAFLDVGYETYSGMYQDDGQTPIERIGVGKKFLNYQSVGLGIQFSVSNGNTMRLDVPNDLLKQLGGLPFQSHMQPIIDSLIVIDTSISSSNFFTLLKGGIAYRKIKFDRCSAQNIIRIDPEFQVGFGIFLNPNNSLHITYRTILGKKLIYNINQELETLNISGIPYQQGILIGALIRLD